MLRVLSFMGVFLLSVIALLLLQPGARMPGQSFFSSDVTRSNNEGMLSTSLPEVRTASASNTQPDPSASLATLQRLRKASEASVMRDIPGANSAYEGEDMRQLTSSALAVLRKNVRKKANTTGQVRLASLVSKSSGIASNNSLLSALQQEAKYGTKEYTAKAMVAASVDTSDVKKRWIENARKQSKAMADATAFMSSGTQATPGFDDTVHIVKRGDSLMSLSIRYYGRTIDYTVIFEANKELLESPDRIRVGQKLIIPPNTSA